MGDKTTGVFVAMILQIAGSLPPLFIPFFYKMSMLILVGLVFVIFAYLWTWLFYAGFTSPTQLCTGKPEDEDVRVPGAYYAIVGLISIRKRARLCETIRTSISRAALTPVAMTSRSASHVLWPISRPY